MQYHFGIYDCSMGKDRCCIYKCEVKTADGKRPLQYGKKPLDHFGIYDCSIGKDCAAKSGACEKLEFQ